VGDEVKQGRWTVEVEGDFVVFIIGAKPNTWKIWQFLGDVSGAKGMQKMLDYLVAHPEKGLLAYEPHGLGVNVQYWRSFEQLEAFAGDKDDPHLEAWRKYWKRIGKSGRSGVWHETFLVKAGQYETIYANMKPIGLGKAGKLVTVAESKNAARERLGAPVAG
jgi:hypothetical protein